MTYLLRAYAAYFLVGAEGKRITFIQKKYGNEGMPCIKLQKVEAIT